jgi:hypothetical protein
VFSNIINSDNNLYFIRYIYKITIHYRVQIMTL